MKKFFELSKKPLIIAIVASVLYIIDALIGGLFIENGSFMWVAFAIWTVFFGVSIKERVTAFIGVIIGFLSAILMMLITFLMEKFWLKTHIKLKQTLWLGL